MERVKKGENYYWLNSLLEVCSSVEYYNSTSYAHYLCGNYFHTKEEAEAMAEKIRRVLKGAIVIDKLPSEEEIEAKAKDILDERFMIRSHYQYQIDDLVNMAEWLKSQLTKEE